MTSYKEIIQKEKIDEDIPVKKLTCLEDIYREIDLSLNREVGKQAKKIFPVQQQFLDYFSEDIYNRYYEFREYYKEYGLFEKVDYNGYLDVILDSIKVTEVSDETEDDGDMEET
jgi:hypothetical protein